MFQACHRSQWLLHAFAIMDNHYHLALETPLGNLVDGVQWLQATFANRFNRYRKECGHLFEGRYKSFLIEPGDALGHACHYIHLNPVRAGITRVEQLAGYRYSSYWYLRHKDQRPAFLRIQTALEQAGSLADAPRGWSAYADFLAWQAAEGPAGKNAAYVSMSRGWAIGSDAFKAALIAEHDPKPVARAWAVNGAMEIRDKHWAAALARALEAVGKTEVDARRDRKSADWKVAVAAHLKQTTQASNRWLTEHLCMGSPVAVSQYVSLFRRAGSDSEEYKRLLEQSR